MRIVFRLAWLKGGAPRHRAFRLPGADLWMGEYVDRIAAFTSCEAAGGSPSAKDARLWVCDRGPGSRALPSEELAGRLKRELDRGTRSLEIYVGGPDGFAPGELDALKPALRWSFGPLTLPHELAAVVAAEQMYRAWAILRKVPYHR